MKRFFATTLVIDQDGSPVTRIAPYTNPSDPTAPKQNIYTKDGSDLCCGVAALPSLAAVSQDPLIFVMDEISLGAQWQTLPQTRRNEIAAAIRAIGFEFNPHGTWSMKQVLESVIHQLQPGVNIEHDDIFDPYG